MAKSSPKRPSAPHSNLAERYSYRLTALSNLLTVWSARNLGRQFDISVVEWRVLATIAQFGPSPAKNITVNTVMDKGNVSRAVQGLEKGGFVTRSPDKSDGRTQIIKMTPSGRRLHKKISAQSIARQVRLSASLTIEERRVLDRALTKLANEAKAMLNE